MRVSSLARIIRVPSRDQRGSSSSSTNFSDKSDYDEGAAAARLCIVSILLRRSLKRSLLHTLYENNSKSRIQHCERSELRLHSYVCKVGTSFRTTPLCRPKFRVYPPPVKTQVKTPIPPLSNPSLNSKIGFVMGWMTEISGLSPPCQKPGPDSYPPSLKPKLAHVCSQD